jgi:hypothetical protein
MTIAFFISITALITAYSLAPFLRPQERWLAAVERGEARRALEAEKESYLRAIKDIEFEHASNKINDRDYADLRKHYGAKAAKTISDIEQLADEEMMVPEKESEQKRQEGRGELESEISTVKEELNTLESGWKEGEVDDDQYFIQYDEYTEELKRLLKELESGQE